MYCTRGCGFAAWRETHPVDREKQRMHARNHQARVRSATQVARTDRRCEECDERLPVEANVRRRFCDRRCINAASLRTNPAKRLEVNHRRRARMAGGPGVSARDWLRLVNRHGGRCAYCGAAGPMTVEHVVPVSRGGQHSIGNVLPACWSCNASKRDDFLIFWRLKIASARLVAATAA